VRLPAHIATSAVLSGVLFYLFRSIPMTIGAFLGGIFLDLDHVLDCYMNFGPKFDIRKTIYVCQNLKLKKIYFLLHSYEFILGYLIAIVLLQKGGLWLGIGMGISLHILLDQIVNKTHPGAYSLIYRYKVGFDHKKLINEEAYRKRYKLK